MKKPLLNPRQTPQRGKFCDPMGGHRSDLITWCICLCIICGTLIIGATGCSRVMSGDQPSIFGRKPAHTHHRDTPNHRQPSAADMTQSHQQPVLSREQALQQHSAAMGSISLPLRSDRKLAPMEEIEFPQELQVARASADDQPRVDPFQQSSSQSSISLAFSDNLPAQANPGSVCSSSNFADTERQLGHQQQRSLSYITDSARETAATEIDSKPPEKKVVLQTKTDSQPARIATPEIETKPVDRQFLLAEPRQPTRSSLSPDIASKSGNVEAAEDSSSPKPSSSSFDATSKSECCLNRSPECVTAIQWQFAQILASSGCMVPRIALPLIEGSSDCTSPIVAAEKSSSTTRRSAPKLEASPKLVHLPEKVESLESAGIRVDSSLLQHQANRRSSSESNRSSEPPSANAKTIQPNRSRIELNAAPIAQSSHFSVQQTANEPQQSAPQFPSQPPFGNDFVPHSEKGSATQIGSTWQLPNTNGDPSSSDDFELQPVRQAVAEDTHPAQFALVGRWMLPVGNSSAQASSSFSLATGITPAASQKSSSEPNSDQSNSASFTPPAVSTTEFKPNQTSNLNKQAPSQNPLRLCNPEFCLEIRGFGQTTSAASSNFTVGQRTLVYCEVENYRSVQQPSPRHGTIFITRFGGTYQLTDLWGQVVQSGDLPEIEDRSQRQRRDFYIYFPITFGDLPAGDYQLTIRLEEKTGRNTAAAPNRSANSQPLPVTIIR